MINNQTIDCNCCSSINLTGSWKINVYLGYYWGYHLIRIVQEGYQNRLIAG